MPKNDKIDTTKVSPNFLDNFPTIKKSKLLTPIVRKQIADWNKTDSANYYSIVKKLDDVIADIATRRRGMDKEGYEESEILPGVPLSEQDAKILSIIRGNLHGLMAPGMVTIPPDKRSKRIAEIAEQLTTDQILTLLNTKIEGVGDLWKIKKTTGIPITELLMIRNY